MAGCIDIDMHADGQSLTAFPPVPMLASGAELTIRFCVEFGEDWYGWDEYTVLLRNGSYSCDCQVVDGISTAFSGALAAGRLEVALMATHGGRRLTSQRIVLDVKDSGI